MFMNDRKQALIFTVGAGGSSMDYHAALDARNQRKRAHYILQTGNRSDHAVQGIGRSHRSNQKQPPHIVLPVLHLPAQRAYLSHTLAKLQKLGAIGQGHRNAAMSDAFGSTESLHDEYARVAWINMINSLASNKYPDVTLDEFERRTQMKFWERTKNAPAFVSTNQNLKRTLNRLARTNVTTQRKVFARLDQERENVVTKALSDRTFDTGPAYIEETIEIQSSEILHEDATSGGKLICHNLDGGQAITLKSLQEAWNEADMFNATGEPVRMFQNQRTGQIFLGVAIELKANGQWKSMMMIETHRASTVDEDNPVSAYIFHYARTIFDKAIFKDLWDARRAALEEIYSQPHCIISGALPTVWHEINADAAKPSWARTTSRSAFPTPIAKSSKRRRAPSISPACSLASKAIT